MKAQEIFFASVVLTVCAWGICLEVKDQYDARRAKEYLKPVTVTNEPTPIRALSS